MTRKKRKKNYVVHVVRKGLCSEVRCFRSYWYKYYLMRVCLEHNRRGTWARVLIRWQGYVDATKLKGKDIVIQLQPRHDDTTRWHSKLPPLLNPFGHSFLTGIHCTEAPPVCTAMDDQLKSSASSSLNTLAISWDNVKVATASEWCSSYPSLNQAFPNFAMSYHFSTPWVPSVLWPPVHSGWCNILQNTHCHPTLPSTHVLPVLHSAHQSVASVSARAETTVFWPGKTLVITATWKNHNQLLQPYGIFYLLFWHHTPSSGYPLIFSTTRVRTTLLWLTDTQTGHHWTGTRGVLVIDCLRCIFRTFGITDKISMDGGTELPIPQGLGSTPPPIICTYT